MKIFRFLLFPFSLIYGAITEIRNYLFDKRIFNSVRFEIPIIAVGNLSMGGTGKTPHVEYLIFLLQQHFHVGTLSRGYGRKTHGFRMADDQTDALMIGDEPMLFHLKFPKTTVAVAEDRIIGVPKMLHENETLDVIILDDAFQHRQIRAGLYVLLTEFEIPFTRDEIVPMGTLRESRKNYHRADIIIVTKCPASLTEQEKKDMIAEIKPYHYQKIFFSRYIYTQPFPLFAFSQDPSLPKTDEHVLLVTGIARKESLLHYLEKNYAKVYPLEFKDHHYFDQYDLEAIREAFQNLDGEKKCIFTTEKDAVRLMIHKHWFFQNKIQIFVQPVYVQFLHNEEVLFQQAIIEYTQTTHLKWKQNLQQPE